MIFIVSVEGGITIVIIFVVNIVVVFISIETIVVLDIKLGLMVLNVTVL